MEEPAGFNWMDTDDTVSRGLVVEYAVKRLEKQLHEQYEWGQFRFDLMTIRIGTLESLGAITFEMMHGLPEAVVANPYIGFPKMVELLIQDIKNEDPDVAWFADEVTQGFIGWVMITEGYESLEDKDQGVRVRSVSFYSISQGVMNLLRKQNDENVMPVQYGDPDTDLPLLVALKQLTDISHYVRVRAELLGMPIGG